MASASGTRRKVTTSKSRTRAASIERGKVVQPQVTASQPDDEDFDEQATRMYQSVAARVDDTPEVKPGKRTVVRKHARARTQPPTALRERMQRERESRPAFTLPDPPAPSSSLRTLSFAVLGAVGALLITSVILGWL